MVEQSSPDFLESWSAEIRSKADRVRNLIGDAHWLSDGNHKETIIRSFIRSHIPPTLTVGHGFIKKEDLLSKQQDVLIFDSTVDPVYLKEDDFYVVPHTSVVATIEIKTTFGKQTLDAALENSQTVFDLVGRSVFRCICFCMNQESLDKSERIIKEEVKKHVGHRPNIIATLSDFCCFIKGESEDIRLALFDSGDMSFALAVIDLLEHIRLHFEHPNRGTLTRMLENMGHIKVRNSTL